MASNILDRRQLKRKRFWAIVVSSVQTVGVLSSCLYHVYHERTELPILGLSSRALDLTAAILLVLAIVMWGASRYHLAKAGCLNLLATTSGRVVNSGPYRYFTHPIYLFGSLGMCSFLHLVRSYTWLALFVFIVIPVQWVRASIERHVLTEKYGDRYTDYVSQCIL